MDRAAVTRASARQESIFRALTARHYSRATHRKTTKAKPGRSLESASRESPQRGSPKDRRGGGIRGPRDVARGPWRGYVPTVKPELGFPRYPMLTWAIKKVFGTS